MVALNSSAQMAVGEWRAHLSYNNIIQTAPVGDLIYGLSDGALFAYDKKDQSIQLFDKINSLSDANIGYIKYSKTHSTLIVVYKNSNIDLINKGTVYNMPDLMNKTMSQDKSLNSINIDGDYAYLATNFGILVLNLKRKEITNTYILNKKVYASTIKENELKERILYAATDKGVFTGNTATNLLDANNWHLYNAGIYNSIYVFNDKLIANQQYRGICILENGSLEPTLLASGSYQFLDYYDGKLIAVNNNIVNNNIVTIITSLTDIKNISHTDHFNHISYTSDDNIFWGSNGKDGLNGYKLIDNRLEKSISSIIPNSPKRNLPYYMTYKNNRLLISGGGMASNRLNNPGTIMMLENGTWSSFQEEGITEQTGLIYNDITSVIEDPKDPSHHFATSGGEGLYEFKDFKFVKLYSIDNSTLQTILPEASYKLNYIRTNGLQYDKNHNLWMVNMYVKNIINVLKDDGQWISFDHPEISNKPTFERIMFDKRGWAWVTSMRYSTGVFCFDTNQTLENTVDDRTKFIGNFINQDGTNIGVQYVLSIAEDKKGAIWIGTDKGPLVINNPTKFFDDNFYFTQIKVPRNDGTNFADFLLAKERITAICIDGANRKWIGTSNNGVFLLSEDGMQTIQHFSTSNSPILSDNIQSITINPLSGEVFIGTDQGLVSYMSDATEAETKFSEDAHAFPNPVRPDYTGVITITGLVKDSDVKITTIDGEVVYSGTSVGGQFTWNGKDSSGKRATSGVYLVLAADANGKEGIATKILMIK